VLVPLFRRSWILAVLLGFISIDASPLNSVKIWYVFSPELDNSDAPTLRVRLEFEGSVTGSSTLVLPTTWAGQSNLFQSISNLKVLPPAILDMQTDSNGEKTLRYPPSHKVIVTYDLRNDWKEPLRHPKEFRPVLRPTNIIFNGQNGLVYPRLSSTDEVQVAFKWNNLPKGWIVAASFGTKKNKMRVRGQWDRVHDALFAAGDFRVTRLREAGQDLILAVRGKWIFSDKDAAQQIMSLFRVEREFWGEKARNSFLVVLTSYDQDIGSSDGTAFTNAFLLYLSTKQTFTVDIKSQLAHEVFHTWNPYRMGEMSGEATEWFTEGFTRYYQDRILLRAGVIGLEEYIERLNQIISAYWSSPVRNWSQSQWLDRAHTGKAESELPYDRGAVVALWLDEQIRRYSGNKESLDDRMRALLRTKRGRLTTESLVDALSNDLSPELKEQLRSFIEQGLPIPMPTRLESSCATLVTSGSYPLYTPANTNGCDAAPSSD
jgi:predicted metalloprotease with PDZ domain